MSTIAIIIIIGTVRSFGLRSIHPDVLLRDRGERRLRESRSRQPATVAGARVRGRCRPAAVPVESGAVRDRSAAHLQPIAHQRIGSDPSVSTVLQPTETTRSVFRVSGKCTPRSSVTGNWTRTVILSFLFVFVDLTKSCIRLVSMKKNVYIMIIQQTKFDSFFEPDF